MPLFKAGPDQPITTKPDVMFHCKKPGYIVLFGTGQFLSDDDRILPNLQSIYGIWDYGDDCSDTEYLGSIPPTSDPAARLSGALDYPSGTFLLRQFEEAFFPAGSQGFANDLRVLSNLTAVWDTVPDTACSDPDTPTAEGWEDPASGSNVGWFFDFPNTVGGDYEGERVVVDPLIRDGRAIVISFTPNESRCAGGGVSMVHLMDACTGARMDEVTLDTNKDSLLTNADLVNDLPPTGIGYPGMLQPPTIIRLDGQRERLIFSTSEKGMETLVIPAERRGFFYWQEKE
jgi:type IV pilus assembly protein PilY1